MVPVVGTELRLVNIFGGKRRLSCLYIVGEDRLVKAASDDQINQIISIVGLADGRRTVGQICEIAAEMYPRIDTFDLLNKLAAYNVFSNVDGGCKFSEVTIFSKLLLTINMGGYSRTVYRYRRILWLILLLTAAICMAVWFWLGTPKLTFLAVNTVSSDGSLETVKERLCYYLLSYLLMFPMFIMHEMSHVTMASQYGLVDNQMCIALYLGFIPMYYIRMRGIYAVSTGKRIAIMLSGLLSNILIGAIFYIAFTLNGSGILLSLAQSNVRIGLVNIIPLSLTDGYYILCNILGQINLRKQYYLFMSSLFCRRKILRLKPVEKIYMITTLLFTFGYIVYELLSMFRLVWSDGEDGMLVYFLPFSALLMLIYLFAISKISELRYSRNGGR